MRKYMVRQPLTNTLNIQQSHNHKAATSPGKLISLQPRCNCCHLPYNKQSLTFCFSELDIMHMGAGVVLYFRFLVIVIIVMVLPTFAYAITTLIQNNKHELCVELEECSLSFAFKVSNLNSLHGYRQLYSYILGSVSILLMFIIPISIKIALRATLRIYSNLNKFHYTQPLSLLFKLDFASNYSEWDVIRTINDWYEQEMKMSKDKQYQSVGKGQRKKEVDVVEKVYFHFNVQVYQAIKKQIQNLESGKVKQQEAPPLYPAYENEISNKYASTVKSPHQSRRSTKSLVARINKIEYLRQKIRNKELEKTNKFIVVFKTLQYCQYIKQKLTTNFCNQKQNQIIFPRQNISHIFEAPFPNEVNYKAQHFDFKTYKLRYRILCWVFNIGLIAIGTALQYLTLFLFKKFSLFSKISPYSSLLITVIFYLLSKFCSNLSVIFINYEIHPNLVQRNLSINFHILITNVFLKCISICLMYLAAKVQIYRQQGLINTATLIMIINTLALLLNRIVNLRFLIALSYRYRMEGIIKKGLIKQFELNKLFQKPDNEIQKYYAQILEVILIGFFYASIIPIAIIICFIFLILSVFLERIYFIYLYKQPQPSNEYLFLKMSQILWKIGPLFLTLGQFYFICSFEMLGSILLPSIKILFFVILSLNLIASMVPSSLLRPSFSHNFAYNSIKQNIIYCYQYFNPLYLPSKPGLQYLKEVRTKARFATRSQILDQQLNLMSRSLQSTLKQKLFKVKNPILQSLGNQDQVSQIYFQFDKKVEMPKKDPAQSKIKQRVPPIFKQSKQDMRYRRKTQYKVMGQDLIKLNSLVDLQSQEQGEQIKTKIKEAIRQSINKIQ